MNARPSVHELHTLTVRRLQVDLSQGFSRHWHGGDAFKTAFFNALSLSFPAGEQFFIESVRRGIQRLPDTPENALLREVVRGFIGQEATHRQLHGLFNAQLQQQGLVNIWAGRIEKRAAKARETLFSDPEKGHLRELAVTAAYEHLTAIFGHLALSHVNEEGDFLVGVEEPLQTLWRWHAAEEIEHRSVAYELYTRLGGTNAMRKLLFVFVMRDFTFDMGRQLLSNLYRDRTLHHPRTWWQGFRFLLGRHGLLWLTLGPLLSYCRSQFHPEQHGEPQRARAWLESHAAQWRAVGAGVDSSAPV